MAEDLRGARICYTLPNRCQKMLQDKTSSPCCRLACEREKVPGYATEALPKSG